MRNGHHLGPFSLEEIQKSFDDDKIQDNDVVWQVGLKNWIPLNKIVSPKKSPSLPVQTEELKENPTSEKSSSNLPLKILALFPIIILALALYFLYPRKVGTELPFSQLDSKTYKILEQSLKAKKPVRELILSKDSRELWLAISRKGKYSTQITLTSAKGFILGEREIILNSKSELLNNWARFYIFDLEKGAKIIPGFYNYTIRLIPNDSKEGFNYFISKIAPFLSDPKTEETFTGTILFSPDSQEVFQKKLSEYKREIRDAYEKPIKEKMEKWEAYLSIVNKVEIMLQDQIKTVLKGPAIVSFEKKYTEFLGPMLSQMVVEAKNLAKEMASNSQEKALENEKIFLFGREIGEATSNLVLEIKKINKFTNIERDAYSKKISETYDSLRKNIENELSKIKNELNSLSF